MSKEEVAKRVEQSLDLFEQGELIDIVAFGEDVRSLVTQAAANKATEEGELLSALKKIAAIEDKAFGGDWDEIEEAREIARQAIAAHLASRQVANKAEVDLSSLFVQTGADIELVYCNRDEEFVRLDDVKALLATPPATTGASTVLTDERISEIATLTCNDEDYGGFHFTNSGRYSVLSFARAIEREVAAQAGQVAVPGWISIEERLPDSGYCLATYRNRHGKLRIIRAKYARQFEIDAGEDAIDQGNCEYNEADDTFYLKAGWLECIDNWDDYSSIYVTEGEVTHWMPLPAAPSPAKESK